MSDKKKFVILLVITVVLIGGAYLLYNALEDKIQGPGLVVQDGGAEEVKSSAEFDADTKGDEKNVSGEQASSGNASQDESGTADGQETAPDFIVYDAEGKAVRLSDFRGKPVIVNFWASWCGPCKSEMPDFQELYDTYGADIHFVMVNMTDGAQETMESASAFIGKSGYTFPAYYDIDLNATYTYGVYSIPTTFFFDSEGSAVAYGQGALDKETLMRGIEMIFSSNQ